MDQNDKNNDNEVEGQNKRDERSKSVGLTAFCSTFVRSITLKKSRRIVLHTSADDTSEPLYNIPNSFTTRYQCPVWGKGMTKRLRGTDEKPQKSKRRKI